MVRVPGGLPHRMRVLLQNSSMPFCCLPNDQLNGLPRGYLSQRQPENCWGNILFYWKWFPSNCHVPYLDSGLSNTQPKGLSLQGMRPCTVRKELAFVWPKWPQGSELVSLWWAEWLNRFFLSGETSSLLQMQLLPLIDSETWMGRWWFKATNICPPGRHRKAAILLTLAQQLNVRQMSHCPHWNESQKKSIKMSWAVEQIC